MPTTRLQDPCALTPERFSQLEKNNNSIVRRRSTQRHPQPSKGASHPTRISQPKKRSNLLFRKRSKPSVSRKRSKPPVSRKRSKPPVSRRRSKPRHTQPPTDVLLPTRISTVQTRSDLLFWKRSNPNYRYKKRMPQLVPLSKNRSSDECQRPKENVSRRRNNQIRSLKLWMQNKSHITTRPWSARGEVLQDLPSQSPNTIPYC